jgi:hypothetical protein
MDNRLAKPSHLVAFGVFTLTLGGFFTLIHVGMSGRDPNRGIAHGFGSRAAPEPAPGYGEALARGAAITADKAGDFISGFFSSGEERPAAERPAADSGGGEGAGGQDPFEEFYNKNYTSPSGVPGAAGFAAGSGEDWGGGSTMSSALAGASGKAAAGNPAAATGDGPRKAGGFGVPGKEMFDGAQGKPGFRVRARPPMTALLPQGGAGAAQGLERPGELSGGGLSRGPALGGGGSLSAMPGAGGAANLNGAEEGARASSQGSYNSRMSGGAAAAAAGGASAPAASGPKEVAGSGGGGSSGGGSSGGDSSSAAGSGPDAAKPEGSGTKPPFEKSFGLFAEEREESKPFLEVVAIEKRSGKDASYITDVDRGSRPDESQLSAGAVTKDEPAEKELRSSRSRPEREPDPKEFSGLTQERKTELKRRIHGFMKRVENYYGEMDEISYAPCAEDDEICRKHELTEGYITLNTKDDAELLLGLKYVDNRWRRYTVGFALPGWGERARPRHRPAP